MFTTTFYRIWLTTMTSGGWALPGLSAPED